MKRFALLIIALLLVSATAFAQKSFDMRYNEAVEYYTTKQYDKAIKVLETAKKSPGVTKDQITKANKLLNQCKASKQKLSDLNLSKESLFFPGAGQVDSIYVTAGKSWEVTSCPDWVTTKRDLDLLYVEAAPNPLSEARKGIVEVSMGKERTAYLVVNQDQRQTVSRTVRIRTVPERAFICIDREAGVLSDSFYLLEGKHTLRLEKSGYERKDTTIVVKAEADDVENEYIFRLDPLFATVSVNIAPEEGYSFDSNPILDISGNVVNLHPATINSFDLDKELSYYELYEGNVIPLHPGQYTLKVSAEGFAPQTMIISIGKAENASYSFVLEPIVGFLSVADQEYALGATIFMDGKEIGEVPLSNLRVKSGRHTIRLVKDGYLTEPNEFEVEVPEGKELTFKAVMHRYVTCSVTSNPDYCKVYLDGNYQGSTPLDIYLTEGEHVLSYEKTGYYSQSEHIRTDFSQLQISKNIELSQAYPLLVTADKDSLGITIWKGAGDNRVVFAENVKTPAKVNLPLSKTPYQIELTKNNLKSAYKGRFSFRDADKNHVNILTWGDDAPMFGVTAYIPFGYKYDFLGKGYSRILDAKVATFSLFPGLSTSVAKATLFWENDNSSAITFGEKPVTDSKTGVKYNLTPIGPNDEGYACPAILPGFSILFINEEFRLGGGVTQHVDANMLVTYAWYPNLSRILAFSHMSGHDVFLGAEINSRLPIFNAHMKIGMQGFFGQANILHPGQSSNIPKYLQMEEVKHNDIKFVVGVGFTLGGREARGQNILRLF